MDGLWGHVLPGPVLPHESLLNARHNGAPALLWVWFPAGALVVRRFLAGGLSLRGGALLDAPEMGASPSRYWGSCAILAARITPGWRTSRCHQLSSISIRLKTTFHGRLGSYPGTLVGGFCARAAHHSEYTSTWIHVNRSLRARMSVWYARAHAAGHRVV